MKAFIIRIKGHELSEELAEVSFEHAEQLGYDVQYFNGISQKKNIAKAFLEENLTCNKDGADISTNWGTQGCFISHFKLWKHCVKLDEPIVVMEHDGLPIRNCESLISEVEHVCHLDAVLPFNTDTESEEDHFEHYNEKVEKWIEDGVRPYEKSKFYGKTGLTGYFFRGAYGYLLKPAGAQRLIDFCKVYGAFPADQCMCINAVNIQRANSTYVRLHPFFKDLNTQRKYTTRTN